MRLTPWNVSAKTAWNPSVPNLDRGLKRQLSNHPCFITTRPHRKCRAYVMRVETVPQSLSSLYILTELTLWLGVQNIILPWPQTGIPFSLWLALIVRCIVTPEWTDCTLGGWLLLGPYMQCDLFLHFMFLSCTWSRDEIYWNRIKHHTHKDQNMYVMHLCLFALEIQHHQRGNFLPTLLLHIAIYSQRACNLPAKMITYYFTLASYY